MTLVTQKLYWTIGEVAIKLQLPETTIRYWCSVFGDASRKKVNNRYFNRDEVARLVDIYTLVKVEKYTLKGAKLKLK